MASYLFLLAGVVIGVGAGWLLRSRRPAAVATEPAVTDSETTTAPDLEPVISSEPVSWAEPVSGVAPVPEAEPVIEAGSAAVAEPAKVEPAVPVVDPAETETAPAVEVETVEPLAGKEIVTIPTQKSVGTLNDPAPATEIFKDPEPATRLYEETPLAPMAEPVTAASAAKKAAARKAAPRKAAPRKPVTVRPEPLDATPGPAAEQVPVNAEPIAIPTQTTPVREPDDLTRIQGIGPKMAMALAAGGITTFEQLAATDVPTLRAAITAGGMRLAPSLATWPEKAKLLAS